MKKKSLLNDAHCLSRVSESISFFFLSRITSPLRESRRTGSERVGATPRYVFIPYPERRGRANPLRRGGLGAADVAESGFLFLFVSKAAPSARRLAGGLAHLRGRLRQRPGRAPNVVRARARARRRRRTRPSPCSPFLRGLAPRRRGTRRRQLPSFVVVVLLLLLLFASSAAAPLPRPRRLGPQGKQGAEGGRRGDDAEGQGGARGGGGGGEPSGLGAVPRPPRLRRLRAAGARLPPELPRRGRSRRGAGVRPHGGRQLLRVRSALRRGPGVRRELRRRLLEPRAGR